MSVIDITQIWNQRLQHVISIEPADRKSAEQSAERLYKAIGRPTPQIIWHQGERFLPVSEQHVPIRHITDVLLYGVWFKIPEIERVRSLLGYNPHSNTFRITSNKSLAFSYMRIKRERGGYLRPQWAHDFGNMICQFDAPFLTTFEYACKRDANLDVSLYTIGHAVQSLLDTAFGAILFNDLCVLLNRPSRISLDGLGLLSSTDGPAFKFHNSRELYIVNGVVLPNVGNLATKEIPLGALIADTLSPQRRVALIEYMGWEEFLHRMLQHVQHSRRVWGNEQAQVTELDKSKWGTLYLVHCGNQELLMVKVRNATEEKDGTHRHYVIPVDHQCRPLPNLRDPNGALGEPQNLSALNAVASTFGMTGREYKDILGAES